MASRSEACASRSEAKYTRFI